MLKTECATLSKISSFIYSISHEDGKRIEISDAKEINNAFDKIVTEDYFYTIIDARNQFNSFSKPAFRYLANDVPVVKENKLRGVALTIECLPNRLLANFFKNFYKPSYPFKVFKSQKEAINWLYKLNSTT